MQNPATKVATAAALGVATTISSPTAYNLSFSEGPATAPRIAVSKASISAGVPSMMSELLIDAKLEAAEARIELRLIDRIKEIVDQMSGVATKIGHLEGTVGNLETKIDSKPGTWKLAVAIGASVLTGFGAVLAALAFAGDRFDGGMSASGALAEKQFEAEQREKAFGDKVDCLILKTADPKAKCK